MSECTYQAGKCIVNEQTWVCRDTPISQHLLVIFLGSCLSLSRPLTEPPVSSLAAVRGDFG